MTETSFSLKDSVAPLGKADAVISGEISSETSDVRFQPAEHTPIGSVMSIRNSGVELRPPADE